MWLIIFFSQCKKKHISIPAVRRLMIHWSFISHDSFNTYLHTISSIYAHNGIANCKTLTLIINLCLVVRFAMRRDNRKFYLIINVHQSHWRFLLRKSHTIPVSKCRNEKLCQWTKRYMIDSVITVAHTQPLSHTIVIFIYSIIPNCSNNVRQWMLNLQNLRSEGHSITPYRIIPLHSIYISHTMPRPTIREYKIVFENKRQIS